MSVLELTDATFDEVVTGATAPVLVEFTAPWCQPCRLMDPVVDAVASELDGDVVVAKVDVDGNPETQWRHTVMGTPTLILFVDGREQLRIVGARGKGRLLQEVSAALSP